jgi:hypothetical protein
MRLSTALLVEGAAKMLDDVCAELDPFFFAAIRGAY